jgi:hypothetical protein
MCGLAAIPVGDIRFEIEAVTTKMNATWPTSSNKWKGEQIIVEFNEGVANREFYYVSAPLRVKLDSIFDHSVPRAGCVI